MKRFSVIYCILLLLVSCKNKMSQTKNHSDNGFAANEKSKPNYMLDFDEEFDGGILDTTKWIPYYLPQWSSREKSRPNYEIRDGQLILQITKKQEPWCPEFNGGVKCSSLQTGLFAGEVGAPIGQHRFNNLCVVREEQEAIRKYTPQCGYFEIRARAISTEPNIVVAFWMIGFEDQPSKSGEICILEIKGKNVKRESALIGYGIHPFGDQSLQDEFYEDKMDIDVTQFHVYAAEWKPNGVDFYIDNKKIKSIAQSPNYPMQFMLNIYELPSSQPVARNFYPKEFEIDYVRGYKPI
jgi:Glycosyl hydrolases family 16